MFYHVANIGDVRSLAIHPATTTHSPAVAGRAAADRRHRRVRAACGRHRAYRRYYCRSRSGAGGGVVKHLCSTSAAFVNARSPACGRGESEWFRRGGELSAVLARVFLWTFSSPASLSSVSQLFFFAGFFTAAFEALFFAGFFFVALFTVVFREDFFAAFSARSTMAATFVIVMK